MFAVSRKAYDGLYLFFRVFDSSIQLFCIYCKIFQLFVSRVGIGLLKLRFTRNISGSVKEYFEFRTHRIVFLCLGSSGTLKSFKNPNSSIPWHDQYNEWLACLTDLLKSIIHAQLNPNSCVQSTLNHDHTLCTVCLTALRQLRSIWRSQVLFKTRYLQQLLSLLCFW